MAIGLIVYDLLYLIVATSLYGAAGVVGVAATKAVGGIVPLPFAVVPGTAAFLVALVALVGLAGLLLPNLRAGEYPLMRGPMFWSWLLRSLLRRVLYFAPIKVLLFTSNVLRWASLRALGAKVDFTVNMSSDVDLLDPALTTIEAGATVGARCLVSAHYIKGGNLVLAPVHIGGGALLAVDVVVGPGVRIGRDCMLLGRVGLNRGVSVGEGACLGASTITEPGVQVPAGARVPFATILRRPRLPGDGAPQDE